MPRPRKTAASNGGSPKPSGKRPIVQYTHEKESRVNNPPVGLVDAASDSNESKAKTWAYDPHLDPQLQWDRRGPAVDDPMSALRSVYHGVAEIETCLEKDESMDSREKKDLLAFVKRVQKDAKFLEKAGQPYLNWTGKAERTSFEVPTVSLHVHERIDPRSILEAVRKKNGSNYEQLSLWNDAAQNPPLRDAIEFYQHRHGWTNRLVAGDSLLVMNSLIEKEGLAGKVQMLYFDPPYGIRYGSNFQPFVNKRDVKDGKDEDLTSEPEMIKAFRDTWELGLHSRSWYCHASGVRSESRKRDCSAA